MITSKDRITQPVVVKDSIIEMKKIYNNLGDTEFIEWYSKRYRVDRDGVKFVVEKYC